MTGSDVLIYLVKLDAGIVQAGFFLKGGGLIELIGPIDAVRSMFGKHRSMTAKHRSMFGRSNFVLVPPADLLAFPDRLILAITAVRQGERFRPTDGDPPRGLQAPLAGRLRWHR